MNGDRSCQALVLCLAARSLNSRKFSCLQIWMGCGITESIKKVSSTSCPAFTDTLCSNGEFTEGSGLYLSLTLNSHRPLWSWRRGGRGKRKEHSCNLIFIRDLSAASKLSQVDDYYLPCNKHLTLSRQF